MMRLLRRLLFANMGLKITALVISTGLWVVFNSQPMVEAAYSAPLVLVNVPSDLTIAGQVPLTVQMRVRGRLGRLRRLEPAELSASADCGQGHPGSQMVNVTPSAAYLPNGAEVVSITPAQIEISLVPSLPSAGQGK